MCGGPCVTADPILFDWSLCIRGMEKSKLDLLGRAVSSMLFSSSK